MTTLDKKVFWPGPGRNRRAAALLTIAVAALIALVAWEVYAGVAGWQTRLIRWEGLELEVPRNFPAGSPRLDGNLDVLSFSVQDHDNAGRYNHFFEVVSSSEKLDWRTRLPDRYYKLGRTEREEITIDGNEAVLTTAEMTAAFPCGVSQKTKVYCTQFHDPQNGRYVTVLTFTTGEDVFENILRSISCS